MIDIPGININFHKNSKRIYEIKIEDQIIEKLLFSFNKFDLTALELKPFSRFTIAKSLDDLTKPSLSEVMKNILTALFLLFTASFLASQIQNSWGDVSVQSLKIPTQNGQWVVADLFKPKTATKENPAPLVIVIPGFQRSKETLSNISIELSRRGIVVIAIDPYSQGSSSSSISRTSASSEGYGMYAVVDYIYNTSNLNYIDKNRIAATGHSAGGFAAARGAQYFGKKSISSNKKSKLQSIYISGMLYRGLEEKNLKFIRSNAGLSYALYDEGAFRNINGDGDMRYSPEAIGLVNSGGCEPNIEITGIPTYEARWPAIESGHIKHL